MLIGAVRSNAFAVKDTGEFIAWFSSNVDWGDGGEMWGTEGVVFYEGYSFEGAYLKPMRLYPPDDDTDLDDFDLFADSEEWDLAELAAHIRQHLREPQEVRFVAAYVDMNHEVSTSVLIIPIEGPPIFLEFEAPDGQMLGTMQDQMKLLTA
jgi:hypothetical protein